jgi:hypothetical protein
VPLLYATAKPEEAVAATVKEVPWAAEAGAGVPTLIVWLALLTVTFWLPLLPVKFVSPP